MQEHIIEVKGTDMGDQYLQTEKASLLACHSYQFLIDNEPFATGALPCAEELSARFSISRCF